MELYSVLRNFEHYTTTFSNELNKNPVKGFVFAMFKSHGRLLIFYKVSLTITLKFYFTEITNTFYKYL